MCALPHNELSLNIMYRDPGNNSPPLSRNPGNGRSWRWKSGERASMNQRMGAAPIAERTKNPVVGPLWRLPASTRSKIGSLSRLPGNRILVNQILKAKCHGSVPIFSSALD